MEKKGIIFNVQHFSLNDGPGIRTVVFFKGCPLNCIWCHNPESKTVKPQLFFYSEKCTNCKKCMIVCGQNVHRFDTGSHVLDRNLCVGCGECVSQCSFDALETIGRYYTVDEVMNEIAKDDVFFGTEGGVTFSGGEPFFQHEFLYELLKCCKEKQYSVCVETSGFASAEKIRKCSRYIDYFLYDYKVTDPRKHQKFVGYDNSDILKNFDVLEILSAKVILRCPIIPDINDKQEHFEMIGKLAEKYDCIKSIELMPYHPLGKAKTEALGELYKYENETFLDKNLAIEYAECIQKLTGKEVRVN